MRFHVQGQIYQFRALPFGLSTETHGVHCNSKGGETNGHTQGYKNPSVPRHQYLGESQIPTGLSPAYKRSSKNVSTTVLVGELRQIRTGTQAGFQLCSLPVRPQVQSGPAHTGPMAEPSRENTETSIPTGLSGLGIHVFDRFINRHRKASSYGPTSYETHTVAFEKQLEGMGITTKGDPNCQVPAPPFIKVAGRRQCTHRPTITPNKTCSADIYRCIKRSVGR